ncbi:MAG: hypothetical protein B7Z42_12260 [Brevundimonas sp. 12-68-7]|nr:MAG: hypothetical protein B7Z42_12260 [Brevundimonas sp. 12-68-7]
MFACLITLKCIVASNTQAQSDPALKQSVAIYPTKEACYLDYGCLRVGEAWFCPTQESEICETYPD